MNLLETLLNAQNGDVLRRISDQFQLDEGQTRSAVDALVPALSRGISNNASSPEGLESLLGALARGNHGTYLDRPDALTDQAAVVDGNGILGHIFGSKEVSREVAARASQSSGVDSGILKQMLPVLASAAMGAMAKSGFGAAGAASGSQAVADQGGGLGGMLNSFLDADKDGSVVDDLIGMAGKFLR